MELLAVIVALEALKIPGSDVTVYTDSRYVADAVEKGWVFNWMNKRFKNKKIPIYGCAFWKCINSTMLNLYGLKDTPTIR